MSIDGRKTIMARTSSEVADALNATARRLGKSANKYLEECVVRCVAADASKVALANDVHDELVESLAAKANELISLAAGYDQRKKAS